MKRRKDTTPPIQLNPPSVKAKKGPKRPEPGPPDQYRSKVSSATKDEPLYDIGGCSASFPTNERYCQNFDHGAFVPLVRQTYESIRQVDGRVDRQMPYCLFLHHCSVYLNAVFLDRLREQGGRPFSDAEQAQTAIQVEGTEYLMPKVIQEYVRNVGKITTPAYC